MKKIVKQIRKVEVMGSKTQLAYVPAMELQTNHLTSLNFTDKMNYVSPLSPSLLYKLHYMIKGLSIFLDVSKGTMSVSYYNNHHLKS